MPFHPPLWNQFKARAQKLKKDTGNVLFIILLAVALFAALAYAVTQSTRSGGGDASREQNILHASKITQYVTSIEVAIERMRISNGCSETQISFENPIISGYTNPNSPASGECHVFSPQGGNIPFQKPEALTGDPASSYGFTGRFMPAGGNSFTWTTTRPPLLFQISTLNEGLCEALAKGVSQSVPYSSCAEAQMVGGVCTEKFTGDYNVGCGFPDDGACGTAQPLGRSFCIRRQAGGYYFFHILITR